MTNDDAGPAWPPAAFAEQLQETSEEAMERQMDLFRRFASMDSGGLAALGSMGTRTAVFKTRVQSGGRISIPDAEREALDIAEGDIVQTVVVPIQRSSE